MSYIYGCSENRAETINSTELSAVVLDVDCTLIRSVRNYSSNNPYPYFKSQYVEEYFHFTLNREPKRSNSVTLSNNTSKTSKISKSQPIKPLTPHTVPLNSSNPFTSNKINKHNIPHRIRLYIPHSKLISTTIIYPYIFQ